MLLEGKKKPQPPRGERSPHPPGRRAGIENTTPNLLPKLPKCSIAKRRAYTQEPIGSLKPCPTTRLPSWNTLRTGMHTHTSWHILSCNSNTATAVSSKGPLQNPSAAANMFLFQVARIQISNCETKGRAGGQSVLVASACKGNFARWHTGKSCNFCSGTAIARG